MVVTHTSAAITTSDSAVISFVMSKVEQFLSHSWVAKELFVILLTPVSNKKDKK